MRPVIRSSGGGERGARPVATAQVWVLLLCITLGCIAWIPACSTTTPQTPQWAFGLSLGEAIDKSTAQPMDALIAGRALYRVRPPHPDRAMSEYAIVTDTASGRILGVAGWDRYSSEAACDRIRGEVAEALRRRYGAGRTAEPADRERMRGLPETLIAGSLTLFAGWDGIAVVGCAGERLVLAFWWTPNAAPKPLPERQETPSWPVRNASFPC